MRGDTSDNGAEPVWRLLERDVAPLLSSVGISLGVFYGRGDWASTSSAGRCHAGREALRDMTEAARVLADLRGRLIHEVRGAEDAAAAADESLCQATWGACPEHGATLASSGGRTWCTRRVCGRSWTEDRLGRHCTEPVSHLVADAAGGEMRLCNGHWIDASERLDGVRLIRRLGGGVSR